MGAKRDELEFRSQTERYFQFLVANYKYQIVSSSNTNVRYESKQVFINVFHGERDYEVGLNFGRLQKDENYSFLMFCRLMGIQSVTARELISDEKTVLEEVLVTLSDALKEHGRDILAGTDMVFDKMSGVRWWHFNSDALGD